MLWAPEVLTTRQQSPAVAISNDNVASRGAQALIRLKVRDTLPADREEILLVTWTNLWLVRGVEGGKKHREWADLA
jgi:hypothetical protein